MAPAWACAAMHNPTAGRAQSMGTKTPQEQKKDIES